MSDFHTEGASLTDFVPADAIDLVAAWNEESTKLKRKHTSLHRGNQDSAPYSASCSSIASTSSMILLSTDANASSEDNNDDSYLIHFDNDNHETWTYLCYSMLSIFPYVHVSWCTCAVPIVVCITAYTYI